MRRRNFRTVGQVIGIEGGCIGVNFIEWNDYDTWFAKEGIPFPVQPGDSLIIEGFYAVALYREGEPEMPHFTHIEKALEF